MERQKYFVRLVLPILGLVFALQVSSGQQSYQEKIYEAYARGKMDVWLEVMDEAEKNLANGSLNEQFELLSYYYGYTGWLISVEKEDLAEDYIEISEGILDKLEELYPENATILAYKGAFIAYEIGLASYKAIYLGRTSMRYLEDALIMDSNNIQAHIEMGNAMYYCPPTFGGDKEVAIKHYSKAVMLMEKDSLVRNNWVYLNVVTALGMAYEATEQIQDAKLVYEKAIEVKPNFMWVGEELYPDLIKRHNL